MKHDLTFPVDSIVGQSAGHARRVFSLYREKQISRAASSVPWVSTSDRLTSMTYLAEVSRLWKELQSDKVAAWRQFAEQHTDSTKHGRFTQAGFNWFVRVNWFRLAALLPIQTLPPEHFPNAFLRDAGEVQYGGAPPILSFSATLSSPSSDQVYVYAKATVPWYNANRRPRAWELKSIVPLSVGSSITGLHSPGLVPFSYLNPHSEYYPPAQIWLSLRVLSLDWWPGDANVFVAAVQP